MATPHLADIGGSQTYLFTVAENLVRLGHEVTCCGASARWPTRSAPWAPWWPPSTSPGTRATRCWSRTSAAYTLAERWPDRPQVVVAHSAYFDLQLPPLVPLPVGRRRMSGHDAPGRGDARDVRDRAAEAAHRRGPPVARGTVRARPRRAVLLGNYLRGEARDAIVEAWGPAGVEVVQVGTMTRPTLGTSPPRPPTPTSASARDTRSSTGWPAAGRVPLRRVRRGRLGHRGDVRALEADASPGSPSRRSSTGTG